MIQMKNICKSFGSNRVLDNVNLVLHKGEILALLGENGAGKSTLMNILGGVLPGDSGEISLDGSNQVFATPAQSLQAGIAFIHQELNLINDLPVYENMFIGNEIMTHKFSINHGEMIKRTQEMFDRLGIDLDPCAMVRDLDASYKQFVEISRALMMNAEYIIMDEPTTSLTISEIERVFDMMRKLKKEEVGIIFISHKLEEVIKICDRYTVLRNGNMVATGEVSTTTTAQLAKHMVGHEVRDEVLDRKVDKTSQVVLKVENLSNERNYRNISFEVRKGEVLGVTGLLGDGRSELFLSIFGELRDYSGKIFLDGEEVKIKNIQDAMKRGIAYVPRNRKENAIILDMNILENGTLASLKQYANVFGIIDAKKQNEAFDKEKKALHIKMGKNTDSITSLSGGNQQKVVLSKWLLSEPKLLILDNPTQGVDVGSREEIYDIIHRLADQGVAIVLLSNEAQEIIRTCNRTLVMFHGSLQGELDASEMSEHKIMSLATGSEYTDVELKEEVPV